MDGLTNVNGLDSRLIKWSFDQKFTVMDNYGRSFEQIRRPWVKVAGHLY